MSEIYTANDLLRYLFNETTAEESRQIAFLLQHNPEAAAELKQYQHMLQKLDDESLNPHPTSVQLVLEHSAKNTKELI